MGTVLVLLFYKLRCGGVTKRVVSKNTIERIVLKIKSYHGEIQLPPLLTSR